MTLDGKGVLQRWVRHVVAIGFISSFLIPQSDNLILAVIRRQGSLQFGALGGKVELLPRMNPSPECQRTSLQVVGPVNKVHVTQTIVGAGQDTAHLTIGVYLADCVFAITLSEVYFPENNLRSRLI